MSTSGGSHITSEYLRNLIPCYYRVTYNPDLVNFIKYCFSSNSFLSNRICCVFLIYTRAPKYDLVTFNIRILVS